MESFLLLHNFVKTLSFHGNLKSNPIIGNLFLGGKYLKSLALDSGQISDSIYSPNH